LEKLALSSATGAGPEATLKNRLKTNPVFSSKLQMKIRVPGVKPFKEARLDVVAPFTKSCRNIMQVPGTIGYDQCFNLESPAVERKLESIISKIWKNSDAEIESKDSHSRRLAKKERDEVGCYQ